MKLNSFDRKRRSAAGAVAKRSQAQLPVLFFQRVNQSCDDAGSGAANGMAQSDGPAPGVKLVEADHSPGNEVCVECVRLQSNETIASKNQSSK